MADDERQRFQPPTPDPPRFGVAGLPAPPPPSSSVYVPPTGASSSPAETAPGAPGATGGRNYSPHDPGLPRQTVEQRPPEPSNGRAVASLTLSVTGIGLLVVSFGLLSFLSLPCSIAGWVLGHQARQRPGEQGMAQGGWVSGIVGTVLSAAALVAWVVLFVAADGS